MECVILFVHFVGHLTHFFWRYIQSVESVPIIFPDGTCTLMNLSVEATCQQVAKSLENILKNNPNLPNKNPQAYSFHELHHIQSEYGEHTTLLTLAY